MNTITTISMVLLFVLGVLAGIGLTVFVIIGLFGKLSKMTEKKETP